MNEFGDSQRTIFLSRSERRVGGRLFLRFSGFNGLGISFLGDATVTLLAIYFGAGNMELGLISAMIHISGIVLLVVPRIFQGKNVVNVGFWAWISRGVVCLPYAFLPFLRDKAAVALIMTVYALFCLSRTTGVSMVNTVLKRLTVSRTQNDLIFRNSSSFQGTSIISRFISFGILSLKQFSELAGLLILPIFGFVANIAAALTFRRIPNRTRVDYVKGESLLVILRRSMHSRPARRVLFLRWISLSQAILFAMAVPFLRRSVGLNAAQIFLYTIAVGLAAFLSSMSLRSIANKAGSRPMLFYTAIPCVPLFLWWSFIPNHFNIEVYAIAGFATMFFVNTVTLAANRLLVNITPDEGAVGFNSMETFVTSVLALILGFGAGFLADLSQDLTAILSINDFGLVFLPAAIGSAIQIYLVYHIEEPGSMGLAESARVITNIDNLKTLQVISNLENTADPVKRKTLVHSVGHSQAPVASSEIEKILAEPLSQEKGELIDALFLTQRPELADFLREEAADPTSFHRDKAVFALGAYPCEATEKLLTELLSDKDPRIKSAAAKGLGRIGSKKQLKRISELWRNTEELHERLDYMIALFYMDSDRHYLDDVFSSRFADSGERTERTVMTLVSQQFGMSPPLGSLYREEMSKEGQGLNLLLEESRETRFLLEHGTRLADFWELKSFEKIWDLCRKALNDASPPPELISMTRALKQFPTDRADSANALAVLYFTYQILTAETGS